MNDTPLFALRLEAAPESPGTGRVVKGLGVAYGCFSQFLAIARWPERSEELEEALRGAFAGHQSYLGGFGFGQPRARPALHVRDLAPGVRLEMNGEIEPLRLIFDFLQGWRETPPGHPESVKASAVAHSFSAGLAGWRWVNERKDQMLQRPASPIYERVVNATFLNPQIYLLEMAQIPTLTCEWAAPQKDMAGDE